MFLVVMKISVKGESSEYNDTEDPPNQKVQFRTDRHFFLLCSKE